MQIVLAVRSTCISASLCDGELVKESILNCERIGQRSLTTKQFLSSYFRSA